ncbi:Zinc finger, RING-type, eukaryotic [Dillenia turbinata]|uniref:RING-type E3 ubiquitin transferase n=1 Tax=Dillenia turbinata TaxID=194707 RepID=A0AAN8W926_9MAGN
MKFGETFMEYLNERYQERFLNNCAYVEYKGLKKVLKRCRSYRARDDDDDDDLDHHHDHIEADALSPACQCQSCPVCDEKFFSELMKKAPEIVGFFSSRARHLLHIHVASGLQKYLSCISSCFKNDQQIMVQEGRMLMEYVIMNAIAIRKILKKYDKVHGSINGMKFKSNMRTKHIELLQSPWLLELGTFYMNYNGPSDGESSEFLGQFSCNFVDKPVMTLSLPDSKKLEYDLSCAICLDIVFNPYALSCGHLFCNSCACLAASVLIIDGPKSASQAAKCPVCRELDLLVKTRCKQYWKERLSDERAIMVKQYKEYWDSQTKYAVGYY